MGDIIAKLYGKLGVRKTSFEPQHSKGLGNEFRCYANFECPSWKWLDDNEAQSFVPPHYRA